MSNRSSIFAPFLVLSIRGQGLDKRRVHSHLVIINRRRDYGKLQIRYRENIRISHLLILFCYTQTFRRRVGCRKADGKDKTKHACSTGESHGDGPLEGRLIGKAKEPFATVLVKRVSFRDWL
jgi:hypothetical protein